MPNPTETLVELAKLDESARSLLFTKGRTANSFSSRPVTDEQLQEIYELMKWGPTWANTLPLRIVYVTTPEGKRRLLTHLQPGNVEKATSAPVNAVLAVDNRYHDQLPRLLPFRPDMRKMLEDKDALRAGLRHIGGLSGLVGGGVAAGWWPV